MALKTAASFVVSALLGSPRGEAFSPSFAGRELDMVSTVVPSPGRAAMNIPTSASAVGSARALDKSRHRRQQPAVKTTGTSQTDASHFSVGPDDATPNFFGEHQHPQHHQQQRHHPASAFYFADEEGVEGAPRPPTTELPAPPPAPAPEPGGGQARGIILNHAQGDLSEPGSVASRSPYHRPWRKRARDARRATAFRNTEGVEEEGGESTGPVKTRASQKEAVVALRKESQQKAITRAALPIVDLVGVVSPLVLLVGITLVQNVP
ncbi:unnamed protein product [Scytosiphon promiscuus]